MNYNDFERIDCLRFPLVLFVVFLHAYPHIDTSLLSSVELYFIRDFITNGISRLSVPIFFCMSGFLFFKGEPYGISLYKIKLKSRLKSVVIPFLLWNSIVFSVFYIVYSIPSLSSFSSGANNYIGLSFIEVLKKIFGLGETPASYQLWFLRDLIYFILISPFIYLIVSRRFYFLIIAFILFLIYIFALVDNDFFSFTAFFYFFVGSGLSYFNRGLFIFDGYRKSLLIIFAGLLILTSLIGHDDFSSPILRFVILVGVFATFSFTGIKGHFTSHLFGVFSSLSTYSFWIFIIHEPLLTILFKISSFLLDDGLGFFSYFIIPVFVFIFSVTTYKFLGQYFPFFLNVLSGGRIAIKAKEC